MDYYASEKAKLIVISPWAERNTKTRSLKNGVYWGG